MEIIASLGWKKSIDYHSAHMGEMVGTDEKRDASSILEYAKGWLKVEGSEALKNCLQLKFRTSDGMEFYVIGDS